MQEAKLKAKRASRAAYFRSYRASRKVAPKILPPADWPENPGQAVATWSHHRLIVPPGHPRSGEPLTLPQSLIDFLIDVYRNSETALFIATRLTLSLMALWHHGRYRVSGGGVGVLFRVMLDPIRP